MAQLNQYYKAFPCTIKPKRIQDNPLMMASILQKNQIDRRHIQEQQNRLFLRTPVKRSRSMSQRASRQFSKGDLILTSTKLILCDKSYSFTQQNRPRILSQSSNLTGQKSFYDQENKPRTPSSIKANIYFNPQIRDAIRQSRNGSELTKYLAQNIKKRK
ncbi:hypothetical protein pb186bvf_000046 [Paramecium bursaria]